LQAWLCLPGSDGALGAEAVPSRHLRCLDDGVDWPDQHLSVHHMPDGLSMLRGNLPGVWYKKGYPMRARPLLPGRHAPQSPAQVSRRNLRLCNHPHCRLIVHRLPCWLVLSSRLLQASYLPERLLLPCPDRELRAQSVWQRHLRLLVLQRHVPWPDVAS